LKTSLKHADFPYNCEKEVSITLLRTFVENEDKKKPKHGLSFEEIKKTGTPLI